MHLSFVRSVSLDKWSEDQVQKMKLGGNGKWKQWCKDHGSSENYNSDMSIPVLYSTHFAAQYRDKLTAELEGRPWSPSDTPPSLMLSQDSDSSAALRKPRAQLGAKLSLSRTNSATSTRPGTPTASNKKVENEAYFASLGSINAQRPDDLPPSQGGKYVGFGSNPSRSISDPNGWDDSAGGMAVLSKGWGFLSSTLTQAHKALNDNVVKPAQEKAADPELQSQVWSIASRFQSTVLEATKVGSSYAAEGLKVASQQAKAHGYDLGDFGSQSLEEFSKSNSKSSTDHVEYSPIDARSLRLDRDGNEIDDDDGDGHDDDDDDDDPQNLQGFSHPNDLGSQYTSLSTDAPIDHQSYSNTPDWSSIAPLTAARQKSQASSSAPHQPSNSTTKSSQGVSKPTDDDGWEDW